ncbi:MAG: hypothetical protein U0736_06060 [Gemmataceae bacterium]
MQCWRRLTVDGIPGNVPGTTGAAGTRLLGSLTPGTTANWVRLPAVDDPTPADIAQRHRRLKRPIRS